MNAKATSLGACALSLISIAGAWADAAEEAAHRAHDAYLAAINANDLERFLEAVTDDVVFMAPNAPLMSGKTEVAPWVAGYFDAIETAWEKTSLEFVVAGDWAFEVYAYSVVDTPRDGSAPYSDEGQGINVYRKGDDGVWRVARDIWATTRPPSGD